MASRYLVFIGQPHNPGGWFEFSASFESRRLAISYARKERLRQAAPWFEVVDLDTQSVVFRYPGEERGRG